MKPAPTETGLSVGGVVKMGSRIVFTGGRLSVGTTEAGVGFPHPSSWGQVLRGGTGMGPRIREDNGWGRGREDGGRVALRLGRLLNTMALNIPTFRSFEVIRRWLL